MIAYGRHQSLPFGCGAALRVPRTGERQGVHNRCPLP
jgi:hypothetical protein